MAAPSISQLVQAIYFAVDRGVNVINMSFSVKQDSPTLKAALDYAVSQGVICVASAGNDGQAIQVWPAAYSDVIGVAATNNQKIRSLFSNFGNSLVSVAAPGEGVITTYPQAALRTGMGHVVQRTPGVRRRSPAVGYE